MRILMTADAVGGVWTYALDLAQALSPYGVQIALATMGRRPSPAQQSEAAAVPSLTLHPSDFALEWMAEPWEDVQRAGDWLKRLETEFQPDIIHLNGYVHGALDWQAPVLTVGHSCVLSWWQAVHGKNAPAEWERYRQEVTRGLQASQMVAAPTSAMRESLQTLYGPFSEAVVIPNGRDPKAFSPYAKQAFVFSAGRLWDEAKNITALADAAEGLPWPVSVAGDSAHPNGKAAEPAGVRLLGSLAPAQIKAYLARAAIYALPARYEPFGLSALEAGLSGCALVLGDIPSLREVWGDAALFVPPSDSQALHTALCGLITDTSRREALAAQALARAHTYTVNRMAEGYLAVYQKLLEETRVCV